MLNTNSFASLTKIPSSCSVSFYVFYKSGIVEEKVYHYPVGQDFQAKYQFKTLVDEWSKPGVVSLYLSVWSRVIVARRDGRGYVKELYDSLGLLQVVGRMVKMKGVKDERDK